MQGDMEGVRQQAEQHLAAVHAEARSTIQKAQATAADLQVTLLSPFVQSLRVFAEHCRRLRVLRRALQTFACLVQKTVDRCKAEHTLHARAPGCADMSCRMFGS